MIEMAANLPKAFRSNVRDRMALAGMSQSELARRMDVSPQYVWNMLNGTSEPGLMLVARVAEALECEPRELLDLKKMSA